LRRAAGDNVTSCSRGRYVRLDEPTYRLELMTAEIRARELRRGDVIADQAVQGGRLKVMKLDRFRGDAYVAVMRGQRVTSTVQRLTFGPNDHLVLHGRLGWPDVDA
jgi:hypothetical protein